MSDPNKIKRTCAKSSLTRFANYFNLVKDNDSIDFIDLENRLLRSEELLDAFNEAQLQIETADSECEANYEAVHAIERQNFEDNYYKIISSVKGFLAKRNVQTSVANSDSSSVAAEPTNLTNIKLPPLNLPTFDGSFDQWLFFRDSFNSIIHDNNALTNVQKFHYLRLSLQGAASDTIKSLQVCDANYAIAWQLLTERFENKPLLVNNHIKELFNLCVVTKESHQGLRQLLDNVQKHLRALEVLQRPTQHWDDLIIYLLTTKFDNSTRRAWESQNTSGNISTLDDLLKFLKERCRILETLDNFNDNLKQQRPQNSNKNYSKSFYSNNTSTIKCYLCNNQHTIYSCPDFLKLNPSNRLNTAKRLRICINCLCAGHPTKDCKSAGCRKCGKIHHTMLHFENSSNSTSNSNFNASIKSPQTCSEVPSTTKLQEGNSQSTTPLSTHHINLSPDFDAKPQILLSTAVVKVFDKLGKQYDCRILLDNGSQSNFISERLCNILQLPKQKIDISVSSVNQMTHNIESMVSVTFKSAINNFERNISCLVLPNITGNLPYIYFDRSLLNIPKNLILADKNFEKPAPVDLLVGADTFWDILSIGQIKLGPGLPILHKTTLGWIISGPILLNMQKQNQQQCYFTTNLNLESQLSKFWEVEECPKTKFFSKEEAYCENHFKQHIAQHSDGRFIATIPLKESPSILGDSKIMATKRFLNLEQKLEKNPDLKLQYHDFINEYIQLGHMSQLITPNNDSGFFLPHHSVLKETSTTTKLRVVFDGSAKTNTGHSLNDIMMVGSSIQDNLFLILLRFRIHNFVLSADIAKMYRQVLISQEQRNLQKILWRFNPDDDISEYTLNTVTYGTASASYLAIRSLHEVAHRHINEHPKIASIILHDFYVDDLLTGCNTIDELKEIKTSISNLLLLYGFPLRKWISNDKSLQNCQDSEILQIGHEENNKTLGLLWNPFHDCLQYSISIPKPGVSITKREILSCTAQIFDPLGLLSPVTVTAKIILKELWRQRLEWDESIPVNLHTLWSKYSSELIQLNTLKIPRHVLPINPVSVELHGFCDASQNAYGACIYVRCSDSLGNCTSNLYCAKSRVAPMKLLTIPRLELCGALLLAELMDKVMSSTALNFINVTYWSDSTIVISWINTSPHLLKLFVANRISQIQNISKPDSWKYINTTENPADLLSRGISPSIILNSIIWFHGPTWLTYPKEKWPSYTGEHKVVESSEMPEIRAKTTVFCNVTNDFDLIHRYSTLNKLLRVFSYILRFKNNLSKSQMLRETGHLTADEINTSLLKLVQIVQRYCFPDEYYALSNSKGINKKSKLLSLNPFFDNNSNVIRVGGRLQNSDFTFSKKHPIVLPANHYLTKLIARHEHLKLLHAGPQALLASIRENYWPISGRNLVKGIVRDCIKCFRFTQNCEQYLMGNLPTSRITPSRPFSITGIDYAGPFLLRDRKGRNYKTTKAYIALFICFASKAIHLEVVSDLTTECFLAALRRFMSRRGKCAEIFSDNGSTFIGANNELKEFFDKHDPTISEDLSNDGIKWHFIPPRSPHFGGIWESGVKSVKYHLKRVIGNAALTYEEFCTVLYQIEACLNSRPLYPLSHDPNDMNPLTPAHLLIGSPLTTIPDHNLLEINENRLSRFQRMQQLLQHFWTRWAKEYVSHLQQRVKWKENCQQLLQSGAMVLVKDDGLPPLKWQLGRILTLHRGSDNITRSVTIKTVSGVIKRPVVKICVLPIN